MTLFKKNDNELRLYNDLIERFSKLMDRRTSLSSQANRAICPGAVRKQQ